MNGVKIQASHFLEIFKAANWKKLQIFKFTQLYRKI